MLISNFLKDREFFPPKIDIYRMSYIFKKVNHLFKKPKHIIHIVGTNGKGSCGRLLAYLIKKNNFRVGHYSSPHVFRLNERIWLNGEYVEDEQLNMYHNRLINILGDFSQKISYFEYVSLLAYFIFEDCDYAIFEAGLGGELDATNVFDKDLSLLTKIGFDHQEFLGNNIKDIAHTKIRSIKRVAIIARQDYLEVYDVAKKVATKKKAKIILADEYLSILEKDVAKDIVIKNSIASFFEENFYLSLSAAKYFNIPFDSIDIKNFHIEYRYQRLAPNIVVDVGHNILSATAIKKELKDKKIYLIYNSLKDKDFSSILEVLKPNIIKILYLPLCNGRVAKKSDIFKVANSLDIDIDMFKDIYKNKEYLVFGSFYVVEKFLTLYKNIKSFNAS